jgi:hypothetical protein
MSRQFDFAPSPQDAPPGTEEIPPPILPGAKPEAEAIREFTTFVALACQKHPDLFLVADNPVLEVCVHLFRLVPPLSQSNLFTSLLMIDWPLGHG